MIIVKKTGDAKLSTTLQTTITVRRAKALDYFEQCGASPEREAVSEFLKWRACSFIRLHVHGSGLFNP